MGRRLYSKKELHALMLSTGYPIASIEKTIRLLDILKAISEDSFLSENLALKGGTAINIIHYQDIPRLSVDLDFDLARNTSRDEMLSVKDAVSTKIVEIALELGYYVNDPRPNYAIHQTELFYQSATGNRDKIKLDINCLSRCHVYEPVLMESTNPFLPKETVHVRILSEYELFGAKLKALLERNTPRDIFDAYTMAGKQLFQDDDSRDAVKKCLIYYASLTKGIDFENALAAIRNKPIQAFKMQLFPMLKSGYGFVDRDKITSIAADYVEGFLHFTDDEREYLACATAGQYKPELLFSDGTELRIANSPAAMYYITNRR